MIRMNDTFNVTEFAADPAAFIERLKRTGEPEFLTVDGQDAVVIQDARTYRRLLEAVDRLEAIEGIRRGLADVEAGRGRPFREAIEDLGRRYEGTGGK